MKRKERLSVRISQDGDDDEVVAYLTLPDHPGSLTGAVERHIRLRDLLGDYTGPDLYFDFDSDNTLVGVEILD